MNAPQPQPQVFIRIFTKGGQIIDMPLPSHLKLGAMMRMVMTDHYLQTDNVHIPYDQIALVLTFDIDTAQMANNVTPFRVIPGGQDGQQTPPPDKPV